MARRDTCKLLEFRSLLVARYNHERPSFEEDAVSEKKRRWARCSRRLSRRCFFDRGEAVEGMIVSLGFGGGLCLRSEVKARPRATSWT